MFQTNLIIWLQQAGPDWFLPVMLLVSQLGAEWVYTPVMLALIFGVRVRPGLAVLLALMLTGLVVTSMKEGFALPRPSDIDARVLDKGEVKEPFVQSGAATSFWALPPEEAIAAVRAESDDSFGFISGHTAHAAVITIATLLFFGVTSRLAWSAALLWPLVMGLSRMYLGRHFPADVLGGLVAGVSTILIARLFLEDPERATFRPRVVMGAFVATVVLAFTAARVSWLSPGALGSVSGVLLCLWVLSRNGSPVETSSHWHRLARFGLALAFGLGVGRVLDGVYDALGLPDEHVFSFVFAMTGYAAALLGTLFLARRLGLYVGPTAATV